MFTSQGKICINEHVTQLSSETQGQLVGVGGNKADKEMKRPKFGNFRAGSWSVPGLDLNEPYRLNSHRNNRFFHANGKRSRSYYTGVTKTGNGELGAGNQR